MLPTIVHVLYGRFIVRYHLFQKLFIDSHEYSAEYAGTFYHHSTNCMEMEPKKDFRKTSLCVLDSASTAKN